MRTLLKQLVAAVLGAKNPIDLALEYKLLWQNLVCHRLKFIFKVV
jgi:hypothetical protein